MWRGYSTPCGDVTKAVASLLSPMWPVYQICGEITCGKVTLWRGYLLPWTVSRHLGLGYLSQDVKIKDVLNYKLLELSG